jgi:hypothetical protein
MPLPRLLSSGYWSLRFGSIRLGGDGGGPRSGAVGGAQRSGPPFCGVDGWAHPTEPRVGPFAVVVGAPGFERGARICERAE